MREQGLLAWQWSNYRTAHRDRRNLVIHALTQPLFIAGTLWLLSSVALGLYALRVGLVLMVVAVAAQGRGHGLEVEPPAPFEGPLDLPKRIFAEQWITFPRFVLSGAFAEAWRNAKR